MYDQLEALMSDHQRYHTAYQMDHFITAKSGGTTWGMYRQALRELTSRAGTLQDSYLALQETQIDLAELEAQAEPGDAPSYDEQRRRIQITRKRIALASGQDSLRDKEREFAHFYQQAAALRAALGDLTPERRDALEREFWAFTARKRLLLEMRCTQSISTGTLEMIWSLDDRDAQAIMQERSMGPAAIEGWLRAHEAPPPSALEASPRLNGHVRAAIECLAP